MKQHLRRHMLWALAAAACMSAMGLSAYGAEKREKVNSIKLKVECKEKPEAGKEIGQVNVVLSDERVEVTEPAEYYDMDDDVWVRGETPLVRVKIGVKDPEKYYFASSTKVTVSGSRSELKSKKVKDSGEGLYVEIRLSKVSGDLEAVEDYYWDGRDARWSEVEDADKYEVKLYRGNTSVATITTKDNGYDCYPHMDKAGEYSFKVRGISSVDGVKGPWSDKSEEHYISAEDARPASFGWYQDSYGWRYYSQDRQMVQANWLYVDNNWFYLGDDGYMKTGWLYIDNHWFYLNPVSDGTRGAMKTGWVYVNGCWYYLNPVSDGTRGAMKTGYQLIYASWYYLDPGSGALWADRYVPDGRWAGPNGMIR